MRALTFCLLSLALLLNFSCSKELSLENSGSPEPPPPPGEEMQWQFEDSLGVKQGTVDTVYIAQQGSLQALFLDGTSDDSTHKILLNIVSGTLEPGTYTAEKVNFSFYEGQELIYFSDPSVGEFNITITSIDSARVSGTFGGMIVDVRTGITSIRNGSFSADLNSVPVGGTSEGTLVCEQIGVFGEYLQNQETNATHYIEFDVNVTKAGTFTIETGNVNGVSYAAQGEFSEAGQYTVQLGAFGTPLETGQFQYTLTYGTSTCTFMVDVTAGQDSLVEAPPGMLSVEQKTFGSLITDSMFYRTSNNKIAEIRSATNPLRKIFYDNANRLATQEFWRSDGLGGTFKDITYKYHYDGSGNVVAITSVDDNGGFLDSVFRYTYNGSNVATSKTIYNSGSPVSRSDYTYVNGNLVKISYTDQTLVNYVDSIVVTYDARENKFRDIHSQYYFIDMANVLEDTQQNEIFFFSNNYPTNITLSNNATIPVNVLINPSFIPTEITMDGQSWFKYFY